MKPDWISAGIAFLSLVVSILAFITSRKSQQDSKRSADAAVRSVAVAEKSADASVRSADASEKSLTTNVAIFKRQGVVDLYDAWEGIRDIDRSKPIVPDVAKALKALEVTASFWNHDIMEKEILHQSFWENYRQIYDRLMLITDQIPGINKTGPELLKRRITKAYEEMKAFDLSKELGSKI